ncbi:hemerythrin domain-containing protein [Nocardioides mangrovi]|uniref:Hemerythrin domain-containing protein n=1 Tax=Nocardioides mangrovi TaxID=2874580 RepID=A0ABS7UIA8_9ACTN|nr:hemerythrin domain-containing protein [Nocardioides mangrovi]MBZ5740771.1 hemerythrin domain-containing protein [Nocardioides mangrovi]
MDITDHILFQHHEQRRMFAILDDLRGEDPELVGAVWKRLANLLEVHAAAEEMYFYPRLLHIGTGAADADSVAEETEDAVKDHNEIRDAVAAAARHDVGTAPWWDAVIDARVANDDHMAEEERQDLADFRAHADLQTRHEIAVQFLTFKAQHYQGVQYPDQDPQEYVDRNS